MQPEPLDDLRADALAALIDRASDLTAILPAIEELWRSPQDSAWLAAALCARLMDSQPVHDELARFLSMQVAEAIGLRQPEAIMDVLPGLILQLDPQQGASRMWRSLVELSASEFDASPRSHDEVPGQTGEFLASTVFDACRGEWSRKTLNQLMALSDQGHHWTAEAAGLLVIRGATPRRTTRDQRATNLPEGTLRDRLVAMSVRDRRELLHIRADEPPDVFRATPVISQSGATWTFLVPTDSRRSLVLMLDGLSVARVTLVPIGGGNVQLESASGALSELTPEGAATLLATRAATGNAPEPSRQRRAWRVHPRLSSRALELAITLGGGLYGVR